MKALITGGAGFVGLALSARLASEGARVVSASDAPPPEWALDRLGAAVETTPLDVRDADAVARVLSQTKPDVVIHAAALTPDLARERAGPADEVVAVNVGGTATVVEAAAAAGVRRVMALSSVAVYGRSTAETPMLDEVETVCAPGTLYAITKQAAERCAIRLAALRGLSLVAPRLGVMWGPWEWLTASRPTPSPPHQMAAAARRGGAIRLASPAASPLLFSEDGAEALSRLLVSDATGVVNVGAPATVDLLALAQTIASRGDGSAAVCDPSSGLPATVSLLAADRPPCRLERLRAAIGDWAPRPIEDGVARYWEWLDELPDPDAPFALHTSHPPTPA